MTLSTDDDLCGRCWQVLGKCSHLAFEHKQERDVEVAG
jgi:hypothetical protein